MMRFPTLSLLVCFASVLTAENLSLFYTPPEISPIYGSAPVDGLPVITEGILYSPEDKALILVQSQTRPLFSPTRRPWVAPALEPLPEPDPPAVQPVALEPVFPVDIQPPSVALIGVQITPNGAKALLLKSGTAEAMWFKSGQQIDEWTIATIENEAVELENGNQKFKLELYPVSTAPALPTQPLQP